MARNNPCLTCGACCTQFRVSFYWAEASDTTPGGVPVELTEQLTHHRIMMKGTGGSHPRCVALEGEIGRSVACSIHPSRPSVCRAFEASYENGQPNERCDQARIKAGMKPLTPDDWNERPPDDHNDDHWRPAA